MNNEQFTNRLKRFLTERAPESSEYEASRRYEGQFERCEDSGAFQRVLVVVDTTINESSRKSLCTATLAAMKARRNLIPRIVFCTWDGKMLGQTKKCTLSQLQSVFEEIDSTDNASGTFSELFEAIHPYKNSAELIMLLINSVTISTMEAKRYLGSSKTILLMCNEAELSRQELSNYTFSVLTLTPSVQQ